MVGIFGRKIGMVRTFNEKGKRVGCTLIEAHPSVITQIKEKAKDGYDALQLGYGEKKEKRLSKALKGHLKKAKSKAKRYLREFKNMRALLDETLIQLGNEISMTDVFTVGDLIQVIAKTKGRGFAGVVKRYRFRGENHTHGQKHTERKGGAIGACATPSRVFPGMRMPGQMGAVQVTVKGLRILKMIADKHLLLIQGAVPGPNGGILVMKKQHASWLQ